MASPARRFPWGRWLMGALASLAAAAAVTVAGAGAFYTATDRVANSFAPDAEEPQTIVAFYCDTDKSVNFAAVEEGDITREGPYYFIMGKRCDVYYDAQQPLHYDDTGQSAFCTCNRNFASKVYPSKEQRIKKVRFLNPVRPTAMNGWFCQLGRVDTVEGLENLDSSRAATLDWCFSGSSGAGLTAIAAALDTRSVTSLRHCFDGAHLEGFNLSSWNTAAVRDMSGAFAEATGGHLDLSAWDVRAVESFDEMFFGAFKQYYFETSGLESTDHQAACTEEWWQLNVSGWQPQSMKSYRDMFRTCFTKEVDLSGFSNGGIGHDPGLGASYIRRITVGENWDWSRVKSGSTPWFAWDTRESFGPWDQGRGARPGNGRADTYDRSCLLAVLYQGTMTVYEVLQTTQDGSDGILGNKLYQVFQRYNEGLYDQYFELDHKRSYGNGAELPWAEAAPDVSRFVFASDISPASMEHWFDGFTGCSTFDLQKIDARNCCQTTPLFANCEELQTVRFGSNWQFAEARDGATRLPAGTWSGDEGNYDAADPLPVPGQYQRLNPMAYLTENGTLHLSDGKQWPSVPAGEGRMVKHAYLGFDWLSSLQPQMPWSSWDYRAVTVDTPLAPASCVRWFQDSSAEKMNVALLDTTDCLAMEEMFDGCDALRDIALGEAFSFSGSGDEPLCRLPGTQWKCMETGEAYTPDEIPNRTAGRYIRGMEWQALVLERPATGLTLSFRLCGAVAEGGALDDGSTVLAAYTGFDRTAYQCAEDVPWAQWAGQIGAVEVPDNLAPTATSYWFAGLSRCKTMNLSGLDTSRCQSMAGMFDGCRATTIELGEAFSFEGCTESRLCNLPEGTWVAQRENIGYRTAADIPPGKADQYKTGLVPYVLYLTNNELHFVLADPAEDWEDGYQGQGVRWYRRFSGSLASAPWHDEVGYGSLNIAMNAKRVVVQHPMEAMSVAGWFKNFTACTEMDLRRLDVSRCTSLAETFAECTALEQLHVESWNVTNVTTMVGAFYRNLKLTELDLSGWQPENCASFSTAFARCIRLSSLDISHWKATKGTDFSSMFLNCNALGQLDLQALNPAVATDLSSMFKGCGNLQQLDISAFTVDGSCDVYRTFEDCEALRTVYAPTWDTAACKHPEYTFSNCLALIGQNGTTIATLRSCAVSGARLDLPQQPGLFSQRPPE